ncbi:MAG TPA: ECF transporter S component [Thermoflexia bacterium]|jgi:energy-coupling factor transport system substrate-specific component|nr:ECF transporter S component [Thermoflexia bacterium]
MTKRLVDLWGALILWLTSLVGIVAFAYPFLLQQVPRDALTHRSENALAALAVLVTLCLIAVLVELTSGRMNARTVATMGVLLAINAALRLVETTLIALPGGFSPVFFLITLSGYVFGARFGFLYGALSLLVSAMITGGVGPWLPYQMLTAGWVGLTAGWFHPLASRTRWEVPILAVFGLLWGFLYGAILNLYFWPYLVGATGGGWEPGLGLSEVIRRYAAFYVVTSLGWDGLRAVGNFLLMVVLGAPVLKILRRFRQRFQVEFEEISPHG